MKKNKLVLLDDSRLILESMPKYLSQEFEVFAFNNGVQVLNFFKTNSAEVVVADHYLEQEFGLELLNHLKFTNSSLITVLITGYPNKQLDTRVKNSSVDLYYSKPFNLHSFIRDIKQLVIKKNEEVV
jgi:response regulator RpfG family c-di-GMP phosphodiesterase